MAAKRAAGTPAAGKAGEAVTQAGSLNRVIDGRPLRGPGEGLKLRNLTGRGSLDQPIYAVKMPPLLF